MKKIALSLTLVIIVVLTSVMFVNAQSEECIEENNKHIHDENCIYGCDPDDIDVSLTTANNPSHIDHDNSENCIYSCVQDDIDVSLTTANNPSHIDHDNSENCLYSCNHAINNYIPTSKETALTIKDPFDGQELKNILDEYTGVVTESLEESKKVFVDMMGIYIDPNTIKPIDDEDIKTLIDEYTGVVTKSLEESKKVFADMLGVSIKEINERDGTSSLYCMLAGHNIIIGNCVEDHSEPNSECIVQCKRPMFCYWPNNPCTWHEYTSITETAHSWSVGWCGQTCTNCDIVQLFHQPGGCWFCS